MDGQALDGEHVVLKLKNGYNVGLHVDRIGVLGAGDVIGLPTELALVLDDGSVLDDLAGFLGGGGGDGADRRDQPTASRGDRQ